MHCAAFVVMSALAVLVSVPAQAEVTWRGDFETGDTSQFSFKLNEEVDGKRYINVTEDTVVEGRWAARIELHNDARWPNGLRRVELQHSPADQLTAEGATVYFAWSIYLPETLPVDPSQQIGYWESKQSFRQMMAFRLRGEELAFVTRQPENRVQWTGAGVVTPGVWHRIAMKVTWSTDPDVGRVSVWFDGDLVVDEAEAKTLHDNNPHFVQFGLLRGDMDFNDVPVLLIDDAIEGSSLEDVRPALEPPAQGMDPDPGSDMGTPPAMDMAVPPVLDMNMPPGAADMPPGATPDMPATVPTPDQGPAPAPAAPSVEPSEDSSCAQRPGKRPAPWGLLLLVSLGCVLHRTGRQARCGAS